MLQHRTDIYKRGRKANLDPDEDQGETPPPLLTRRDPPAISANTRDGLAAECGARIYFIRSPARRPSGAKAGAPEAWPARSAARGDSLAVTGGRAASHAPPRSPSQPRTAGAGPGAATPAASSRRVRTARPTARGPPPAPAARPHKRPPTRARSTDPAPARPAIGARPARPARPESSPQPRRPGRFHNGSASTVGRLAVLPLAHPPLPGTGPAPRPPSTQPRRQGDPSRRPAPPAAGGGLPVRPREPQPQPPPRVASPASATAAALQEADGGREASAQSALRAFGIASNQRSPQSRLRPSYPSATQGSPEAGARGAAVGAAPGPAAHGKWTAALAPALTPEEPPASLPGPALPSRGADVPRSPDLPLCKTLAGRAGGRERGPARPLG